MTAISQFWAYITTADHWSGPRGIWHQLVAHMRISLWSTVTAFAVAVPLALYLGHIRRGGVLANVLVNIGRAVPTFALVSLLFPISLQFGFQLGFLPTYIALVLLGIPPMFTNTYAGIVGVDPGVVDAAKGMGMRSREVLWKVEAPNALPLIIAGTRIAAVQIVATATLGALVGYGNLGSLIVKGLTASRSDLGPLLTGATLVAVLAIATDAAFGVLERVATPWRAGTRRSRRVPKLQYTKG